MADAAKYHTGDILVVPTRPIGIFNHFSIVYSENGKQFVAHNSFTSGKVISTPLDEFLATRNLLEVIPSDGRLDDAWIANKVKQLNEAGVKYGFFSYNCEEFIKDVCGCNIGRIDQRAEFGVLLLVLMTIVFILLFILNRLK